MRKKLFPEENKTVIYAPPPSGSKKNEASPSRPWIISTHATALSSGVDPDPNWILIQQQCGFGSVIPIWNRIYTVKKKKTIHCPHSELSSFYLKRFFEKWNSFSKTISKNYL